MSEISGRELGCAKNRRKRGEGNQLLVAETEEDKRCPVVRWSRNTHTQRKWGSTFAVVESPRVFCNSGLLFDVAELKKPPVEDDSKTK